MELSDILNETEFLAACLLKEAIAASAFESDKVAGILRKWAKEQQDIDSTSAEALKMLALAVEILGTL
jgi:hypothetical protein